MAQIESTNELENALTQLRDPDWNIRHTAARDLIEIGQPAVEPLILLLEEEDSFLRAQAAVCLGRIADPSAIAPLIECFSDSYSAVREEAVRAVGFIGAEAVEPLMDKINHKVSYVRKCAIQALAAIQDASARDALQQIADDMDAYPAVRWEAKLAVNRFREGDQKPVHTSDQFRNTAYHVPTVVGRKP